MKNLTFPNELQRRALAMSREVIMEVDGKPFTNWDKVLLVLRTSERPEDRKLLLSIYEDAAKAEHAWREQVVLELIAYKKEWGPRFAIARRLGRTPPCVYPDPDDIRVLSATEWEFLGPVDREEAELWQKFIAFRELCVRIVNEFMESAGLFRPLEEDRRVYLKFRRIYYRASRHISRKFKKRHPFRFPPFKPPTTPPDWYLEEEGE